jgi:hypothetical protein
MPSAASGWRRSANNQWNVSRETLLKLGAISRRDHRRAQVFAGVFDRNVSRETFLLCQVSSGERNAQRFLKERDSDSCESQGEVRALGPRQGPLVRASIFQWHSL